MDSFNIVRVNELPSEIQAVLDEQRLHGLEYRHQDSFQFSSQKEEEKVEIQ